MHCSRWWRGTSLTGRAEECEFVPGLVRLPNSETRRRNSETVNVSSGSRRDRHLVEFIAGKLSVKFRHLEAAIRHRVFPTLMCTPQLCSLALRIALPAAVQAGNAAHSYSVFRKRMSESGAWYRRICVLGASSRASALSFIARSAST